MGQPRINNHDCYTVRFHVPTPDGPQVLAYDLIASSKADALLAAQELIPEGSLVGVALWEDW